MKRIINIVFPFSDFLYLLQLEEYKNKRYVKILPRFFFRRNLQVRQTLVYTQRIKITLLASVAITLFFAIFMNIFSLIFIPIWVLTANIVLDPVYAIIKLSIQEKASKYFSENFTGKVIAVAGSFGKTTTKNYIYELIKFNYKTQMIPGNINTPTGIANWVLDNFEKATEILIVEMDTYFIGEIKRSCAITPPDIAVLTNVGDQHLERFGSRDNLEWALFEIFRFAKRESVLVSSDQIDFKDFEEKKLIRLKDPTNVDYAIEVAKILNIPKDIIKDTVKRLEKPDRRGDIKEMHGFTVVDESYNISETTAKIGLENALRVAKKQKKNLIVITAGIPELGEENRDANINYGQLLAKSNVEIVLLKSILHSEVAKNISDYKNLHTIEDFEKAWKFITENYSPKKEIVLMQPELGDQYY